ncbi:MAG: hypothetical protein F6K14_24985, partial [Symploca sp. SIO2C1]|nr:hypothetical protein [Symploca sp. SIO2C1]
MVRGNSGAMTVEQKQSQVTTNLKIKDIELRIREILNAPGARENVLLGMKSDKYIIGEDHRQSGTDYLAGNLQITYLTEGATWISNPLEKLLSKTEEKTEKDKDGLGKYAPLENEYAKVLGHIAIAEYACRSKDKELKDFI